MARIRCQNRGKRSSLRAFAPSESARSGSIMHLDEHSRDPDCGGCARQRLNVLRLAAREQLLPHRQLHAVSGIENDRVSGLRP